ncbi:unnamed protein product [Effrenium voratum]|nr:unnamed protein product [Effrenium voratum]
MALAFRNTLALVMLWLLPPQSVAGPGYLACHYGCLGVCFTAGVAAAGICPPAGLSGAAACTSGCAAACTPTLLACFSEDTRVQVLNGTGVAVVPLSAVAPGQRLWSFYQSKPLAVKVLENQRLQGNFSFVELVVVSGDQRFSLAITESHNMPRLRRSAPELREAHLEVATAEELRVGDIVATGVSRLGFGVISELRRMQKSVKHVLTTETGSVMANNILSSTICDGRDDIYNRSSWLVTLNQWQALHEERLKQM